MADVQSHASNREERGGSRPARSRADVAAALTGIAGPDPDEDSNPVGLVCIAVVLRGQNPEVIEKRHGWRRQASAFRNGRWRRPSRRSSGSPRRHTILSEIDPFTKDDELRIVIETPRGSRNKYSYDPDCDCMQLSTVLPEGIVFPYDFGFIPSTLGQHGDPLDILILMDQPVIPGCVVRARLIGAIEAEQKEKNEDWMRMTDSLQSPRTRRRTMEQKSLPICALTWSRRSRNSL